MDTEPIFLTLGEALELHDRSIQTYGGSPGVRDFGLLESALAVPQATFSGEYLHTSLQAMASAYLFHLVKNHPFVDGNKRTGALAARTFLLMNGIHFNPSEKAYGDLTLSVAASEVPKDACNTFFEKHAK